MFLFDDKAVVGGFQQLRLGYPVFLFRKRHCGRYSNYLFVKNNAKNCFYNICLLVHCANYSIYTQMQLHIQIINTYKYFISVSLLIIKWLHLAKLVDMNKLFTFCIFVDSCLQIFVSLFFICVNAFPFPLKRIKFIAIYLFII